MTISSTGDTKLGGTSLHIIINPKATYLRTNGDASALNATAINLTALGIAAGDILVIEQTGDFDPDGAGAATDSATGMAGVFSTSVTLTASANLNRVSGAVAAQDPVFGGQLPAQVTPNTVSGNLATDITQDFFIGSAAADSDVVTQVPAGAGFLFVSPNDGFFGDNTDPDADFGINIYRPMVVGAAGVGTLTITGGTVYRDAVVAGAVAAGNGTITIQSAAILNIGGNPTPDGASTSNGVFIVGLAGTGTATISGGSVVTSKANGSNSNVQIGVYAGAVGTVTVTGAGSKLISAGLGNGTYVGYYGTGTLNVLAGGEVQSQRMFVGSDVGGSGTVTISGAGSKLTLAGAAVYSANSSASLSVGNRGNGTMTVQNNAAVTLTGAQAHLLVGDGNGLAGPGGTGTLIIRSGGDVTVTNTDLINQSGAIDIGNNQFGNGTVTVTGAGSTLTAAGTDPSINVGNYGTGVLNVQAGGTVVSLFMAVGNQNGSHGTLNITGAGSKVVLSNDTHTTGFDGDIYGGGIAVGRQAGSSGVMNITAGGVLELRNTTNENAPSLRIGNQQGAVGVVTIDGLGTAVNITQTGGIPNLFRGGAFVGVGGRGDGTLTVSNNAQINMTGEYGLFRVSRGNTDGEIGAPARAVLSEAFIQSGADVTLNMTGGTYYGANALIGNRTNGNGRLTIDGNGSTLTVHGDNAGNLDAEKASLIVAGQGQGELIISNGADVAVNGGDDQRPLLAVGQGSNSLGTLTISGVGSTINLATTNVSGGNAGTSRHRHNFALTNSLLNVFIQYKSLTRTGRTGQENRCPAMHHR